MQAMYVQALIYGTSKLTLSPSEAGHASAEERIRTMNAVKAGAMTIDQALTIIKARKLTAPRVSGVAKDDNKNNNAALQKKKKKAAQQEAKQTKKTRKQQLARPTIDHLRPFPDEEHSNTRSYTGISATHAHRHNPPSTAPPSSSSSSPSSPNMLVSVWDQLPQAGVRTRAHTHGAAARAAQRACSSSTLSTEHSNGSSCSDGSADLNDILNLASKAVANDDTDGQDDDYNDTEGNVLSCDLCAMVGHDAPAIVSCDDCAFSMCDECDQALHCQQGNGLQDRESAKRALHTRVPLHSEHEGAECKCAERKCSSSSSSSCCSSSSSSSSSCRSDNSDNIADTNTSSTDADAGADAAAASANLLAAKQLMSPKQVRVARRRAQLQQEKAAKREESERANRPPRFAGFDFSGCFIYTASDEVVDGTAWNTHKAKNTVDEYPRDLTPEETAAARTAAADPDAAQHTSLVSVVARIPLQEEMPSFQTAYKTRRATLHNDTDEAAKSKYAFYNRRLRHGSKHGNNSIDVDVDEPGNTDGYGSICSSTYSAGNDGDSARAGDERHYDVAGYLLPSPALKQAPLEPEQTYADKNTFVVEQAQAIPESAVAITLNAEDKHRRSRPAARMFAALPTHRELAVNRTRAANLRRQISKQQSTAAEHADVLTMVTTPANVEEECEEHADDYDAELALYDSPYDSVAPCPNAPPPSPVPEEKDARPSWFLEGLDTATTATAPSTTGTATTSKTAVVVVAPLPRRLAFSEELLKLRARHDPIAAESVVVASPPSHAALLMAAVDENGKSQRQALANRMARMLQRAGIVGTSYGTRLRLHSNSSSVGSFYGGSEVNGSEVNGDLNSVASTDEYVDNYVEHEQQRADEYVEVEDAGSSSTISTIASNHAPPSLAAVLNMGVSMPAARSSWDLMGELRSRLSMLNVNN